MLTTDGIVLVTGGHGFIGGHVVRHLASEGFKVRVADVSPKCYQSLSPDVEVFIGNLLDPNFCHRAVHGVHTVMHFAATMGGMGVIHSNNDFIIYAENHTMTLNLLSSSLSAGIKRFLYASSACVYPDSLQGQEQEDVSLKEADAYINPPPSPQGLYGLEKLNAEHLLLQFASRMDVHIARFHNIFGPGGAWRDGREKAPAAFLRKAFAAKLMGSYPAEIEIWGDGSQRRSFCFIDDAVEAIIRLLRSHCHQPLNIGSDRAVTIQQLAGIAASVAGLDMQQVRFRYISDRPLGVGSRNSNNALVMKTLNWNPTTSLEEGMRRTGAWISGEIEESVSGVHGKDRGEMLKRLQTSKVVNLISDTVTFAILLPITSRGSVDPADCLTNLLNFARSLAATTLYEVGRSCQRYSLHIYVVVDHDDKPLLEDDGHSKPERLLRGEGFIQVTTLVCNYPPGYVCALWRESAQKAWLDGCDYFILLGDDVTLQDPGWMSAVHDAFGQMASEEHVPEGFGCVAFTDTSFPGMPTFPVVHRTHIDIFDGEVVPMEFVNQDGDPYLFQLYRRWGCSRMIPSRIRNKVGGSGEARYEKQPATDWTFRPLDRASAIVTDCLLQKYSIATRKLTLDVIIPCYRVDLDCMDRFLALQPSPTCTVMFIIIVDDPNSPNISSLLHKHSFRPDVRIRVNDSNQGASASRNRGLRESSAEWVIFLDDDVCPDNSILIEAEKVIHEHPDAAGFVGAALFPIADTVATAAIHLAGVTYFWDIAKKRPGDADLPWGVTANLMARRNVEDHVEFDLAFPKTGGGEDIDYCLRKRNYSVESGRRGFHAASKVAVTHPYWNDGRRSYWRFYMWSKGDGALIGRYPELSYRQAAPNSAESLALCIVLVVIGCFVHLLGQSQTLGTNSQWSQEVTMITRGMQMFAATLIANLFHDLYRHLWRDASRLAEINMSVRGPKLVLSVMESTVIRIFSEYGRLVGMMERREFNLLGHSFDWFTNRLGEGPRNEENWNRLQRLTLSVVIVTIVIALEG